MILVHLASSWPDVLAGKKAPEDVTLRAWAQIKDEALDSYGDGVLGIYQNTVVTAFDVTGWERQADNRVVFNGVPSAKFEHLIGTPNPGKPWVQGQARPVQYVDTAVLTGGSTTVEDTGKGRRAVVGDFILTVGDDGSATLVVPRGGHLTVMTASE